MSKKPINTVKNIDEVEQISLFTTGDYSTKSHRFYRVTLHFLDFHQNIFSKIPTSLLLPYYRLSTGHIKFFFQWILIQKDL